MTLAFRITDVTFRFRGANRLAVASINLEVERGTIIGLLGPNGSGKTTLIRLLASVLRPTNGHLQLFPEEPGLSPDALRRRVAVCFDRIPLLDALPGREGAIRLTGLRGVGRAEAGARVDRWLRTFELVERATDEAGTYSLGMSRKLALVEVFAAQADLLLLDEPLGGLDAAGRNALLTSLRGEATKRGATALVAVHDPTFAAAVCDQVVLMEAGRVLASGAPDALIRSLHLQTMFDVSLGAPVQLDKLGLPARVTRLGVSRDRLRFANDRGATQLPAIAEAIGNAGGVIRSIRVREPNLDDVYLSLTGHSLESPEAAGS